MKIKLILDVNKSENAQLNYIVTGRVGDIASNIVDVYIVDGGNPYPLTNLGVFYECTKPDSTVVRDSAGVKMIDTANGRFEYTFPKETFSAPGRAKRSFFAIEKDKVIRATTQDFTVVSLRNALDGNVQSGTYISDLEKLIEQANGLIKHIRELEQQAGTIVDKELATIRNKVEAMLKEIKAAADKALRDIDNGVKAIQKQVDDLKTQISSLQSQIDNVKKQIESMNVVKKSGDTMTGVLTTTSDVPFIIKKAGKKSWLIHRPANLEELIFAPSKTIDGTDWDWGAGIKFEDYGKIMQQGSHVATLKDLDQFKQKYQVTADNGLNINISKTNLNDLKNIGFYMGESLQNAPITTSNNWWFIEVQKHTDTWVFQRATLFNSAMPETYERFSYNGEWKSWKKTVTHTGWGNWRAAGQDLLVHDKRALVGTPTSAGDGLIINYGNDFKNGVNVLGALKNNGNEVLTKPSNDTDWINLTLINGATVDGGRTPKYKCHNNAVYIVGAVANIKDSMTIANIPSGLKPPSDCTYVVTYFGTDNKKYFGELNARADGRISVDWMWNNPKSASFCISYHL